MTAIQYLVLCGLLATASAGAAEERPLPDVQTFLNQARSRLQRDDVRQRDYTYVETQHRTTLDGSGRSKRVAVKVVESYPGFPGEDRWERVIEEDGRPIPAAELRQKDAERQTKAERYAVKLATATDADRAKAARELERDRRERDAAVDDVFSVYEIALLGREVVSGHDTIVLSLSPRLHARTKTRAGKYLRDFKGRAWVSESDFELVKLEVEAIQNVSIAMGLLARVDKGATASFERRKIDGEVWLPARAEYRVNARLLLFKRLRESVTAEFSNYRKFTVETATTIAEPLR